MHISSLKIRVCILSLFTRFLFGVLSTSVNVICSFVYTKVSYHILVGVILSDIPILYELLSLSLTRSYHFLCLAVTSTLATSWLVLINDLLNFNRLIFSISPNIRCLWSLIYFFLSFVAATSYRLPGEAITLKICIRGAVEYAAIDEWKCTAQDGSKTKNDKRKQFLTAHHLIY